MKAGLFTALIALTFAVFSVADAYGMDGSDLHMEIFGANVISSDMDGAPTPLDGRAITAIQSGQTKGSGSPSLFSTSFLDAVDFGNPPPGCTPALPFGAAIGGNLILTYRDGSLLSLEAGPGSFYCTDGLNFTVEWGGDVVGGNRRFEDAAGSWEGSAQTFPGGRFTGELSVDLE